MKAVNKLNKTIETKSGVIGIADGLEVAHNSFITVTETGSGIADRDNAVGQRIGDKILPHHSLPF